MVAIRCLCQGNYARSDPSSGRISRCNGDGFARSAKRTTATSCIKECPMRVSSLLQRWSLSGRDVRRVLPIDPYGFLCQFRVWNSNAAENGSLTLRVQYRGWTGAAYQVSQAEWDRLSTLEQLGLCATWKEHFQTSTRRCGPLLEWTGRGLSKRAGWWACNDGTKAAQAYTNAMLLLAIEKRPCPESERIHFGECSRYFHGP